MRSWSVRSWYSSPTWAETWSTATFHDSRLLEAVEAVLEQVQTGRVTLAREGSGGAEPAAAADADQSIEAAYFQLVLIRPWKQEQPPGPHQPPPAAQDHPQGPRNAAARS